MEIRYQTGLVINYYTDEVMGLTWLRVLTENSFESIKLPRVLEKYTKKHLINPLYVLDLELIKTRKNWILKDILNYRQICQPQSYQDFVKHSEKIKLIQKYVYQDQRVEILDFLLEYFQKDFLSNNVDEFEAILLEKLGFSDKLEKNADLKKNLYKNKDLNGLI